MASFKSLDLNLGSPCKVQTQGLKSPLFFTENLTVQATTE